MSEFTDGLLIRKSHAFFTQVALTDLTHPYIYKVLNAHWIVITFEDANPQHEPVHSWILRHSQQFPMLWFDHAEDHGWGYKLFHHREEKASLNVEYAISEGMALELAETLYPGVDFYDFYGALTFEKRDQLYAQVTASDDYRRQVAAQYAHTHPEAFAVFGLAPDSIAQLREILRPEYYGELVEGFSQLAAFQQAIGIEEMSWVSYHYLSRDDAADDSED